MAIDRDQLRISPLEEMTIRWETIGKNRYPLIIIDNFYRNPEYVNQLVHSLDFADPDGGHTHAFATLAHSTTEIYEFIWEQYACKWGGTGLRATIDLWEFYRSLPPGSGLLTRREDPHSDWGCLLAGLVYLTPDHCCRGGTAFYRHRQTGAEEKLPPRKWLIRTNVHPSVLQQLNAYNVYRSFKESSIQDYRAFLDAIPSKTQGNQFHLTASNEVWEQTKLVEMKFNRLIVYPGFVLHKAIYEEDWFDGDVTERRLTQNFFLEFPTS
jgi:hypothetical protein